jgi:hypothetical protein
VDNELQGAIIILIKKMFKVNHVMQNTMKYKAFVLLAAVIAFSGCRKIFNLPDEKNYLSTQADYTTKDFEPIMGRTYLYTNIFNSANSSFPMTFEIKNPRFGDGRDASDMLAKYPTLVWTGEYSGKETSLAQIEAKRKIESHSILEVRGSGDIIFWYTATPAIIKPADSVVYPQARRYFDMKISNSGGTRTIKNLTVSPKRDRPYFPDGDYNPVTGQPLKTLPAGGQLIRNLAGISNIRNAANNLFMDNKNAANGIVYLYIRKFTDPVGNPAAIGHRLRFKFLDKDSVAIDPFRFNATKWIEQVHGFDAAGTAPGFDQTHTYVEYNVAYPIPLAKIPTKYTVGGVTNQNGGDKAHAEFSFTRTGFGNVRETGKVLLDFAIYEKGDWEIVFHFKTANPKFAND